MQLPKKEENTQMQQKTDLSLSTTSQDLFMCPKIVKTTDFSVLSFQSTIFIPL